MKSKPDSQQTKLFKLELLVTQVLTAQAMLGKPMHPNMIHDFCKAIVEILEGEE